MPEFIAVKCCNDGQCGLFQVVQRRKDNKWQCRLCNQKQSITKIYAVSFKAADLRPLVQEYNMKKSVTDRAQEEIKFQQRRVADELLEAQANAVLSGINPFETVDEVPDEQPKQSRWSKYLDTETQANDESDEDDARFTTVAPQGKRKGGKLASKTSKKPNSTEEASNTTNKNIPKSQNMNSSISNNKNLPSTPTPSSTSTRKYNQMFASNDSDEDSPGTFQPPLQASKQTFNNPKGVNNNQSTNWKQQAPSNPSSGSKWSKYVEDNNEEEDDDDQYVTSSAVLDAKYQVVQDPQNDD